MPDLSDLTGGPFEYVDGGIGSPEDGQALKAKYPEGLAGKIVLVKRGSLTFQDKFNNIAGSKRSSRRPTARPCWPPPTTA